MQLQFWYFSIVNSCCNNKMCPSQFLVIACPLARRVQLFKVLLYRGRTACNYEMPPLECVVSATILCHMKNTGESKVVLFFTACSALKSAFVERKNCLQLSNAASWMFCPNSSPLPNEEHGECKVFLLFIPFFLQRYSKHVCSVWSYVSIWPIGQLRHVQSGRDKKGSSLLSRKYSSWISVHLGICLEGVILYVLFNYRYYS